MVTVLKNFIKAPLAPILLILREERAPKKSNLLVKTFQKVPKNVQKVPKNTSAIEPTKIIRFQEAKKSLDYNAKEKFLRFFDNYGVRYVVQFPHSRSFE